MIACGARHTHACGYCGRQFARTEEFSKVSILCLRAYEIHWRYIVKYILVIIEFDSIVIRMADEITGNPEMLATVDLLYRMSGCAVV